LSMMYVRYAIDSLPLFAGVCNSAVSLSTEYIAESQLQGQTLAMDKCFGYTPVACAMKNPEGASPRQLSEYPALCREIRDVSHAIRSMFHKEANSTENILWKLFCNPNYIVRHSSCHDDGVSPHLRDLLGRRRGVPALIWRSKFGGYGPSAE
jgi:hypothetical protein